MGVNCQAVLHYGIILSNDEIEDILFLVNGFIEFEEDEDDIAEVFSKSFNICYSEIGYKENYGDGPHVFGPSYKFIGEEVKLDSEELVSFKKMLKEINCKKEPKWHLGEIEWS